jgi:hypothetical protein
MLAVEPPSSGFSSDAIGKYSAVDGTYRIEQRFNKEQQSISNANVSMNRKEIHLSWLVVKVIRFLKGRVNYKKLQQFELGW